jgi:hypothetical protein
MASGATLKVFEATRDGPYYRRAEITPMGFIGAQLDAFDPELLLEAGS